MQSGPPWPSCWRGAICRRAHLSPLPASRPGERDPFVDVVLEEVGLDLGRRQPQTVDELEDDYFDLVISLAPEAHHRALEMTRSAAVEAIYWPTPDPTVATGTRGPDRRRLSQRARSYRHDAQEALCRDFVGCQAAIGADFSPKANACHMNCADNAQTGSQTASDCVVSRAIGRLRGLKPTTG